MDTCVKYGQSNCASICGHVTYKNNFILMFSSYKKNGRTYMNYFIKFVICFAKTYVWFELHITFWESLDLLNTDKKIGKI